MEIELMMVIREQTCVLVILLIIASGRCVPAHANVFIMCVQPSALVIARGLKIYNEFAAG
jgi:hypothetical protein